MQTHLLRAAVSRLLRERIVVLFIRLTTSDNSLQRRIMYPVFIPWGSTGDIEDLKQKCTFIWECIDMV